MVYRHMDSRNWNELEYRAGDVVVGSYAKSGTTWVQQIVRQLIFHDDSESLDRVSPWIDSALSPKDEVLAVAAALTGRRCLKTHLPVDALVFSPGAKYLYVARDGRDVAFSLFNHFARANEGFYALVNDPQKPGLTVERPTDVRKWFRDWLERDGFPIHPFWCNVQSWWDVRYLPNVKLLHFARLKADLRGQMEAIADFLEVRVEPWRWPELVERCTFEYMKRNADRLAPLGGTAWQGGGRTFIHQGKVGAWRGVLCDEDVRRYEAVAAKNLTFACARWLASGDDRFL